MKPAAATAQLFVDWIDRLWDLIEMRENFENPRQREEVKKLIFEARQFYAARAQEEPEG